LFFIEFKVLNALATLLEAFSNIFCQHTHTHTDTVALLYLCCTCTHRV